MAYDDQVHKQQQPPQSPLQDAEEEEEVQAEQQRRLAGWADLPEELLISIIIHQRILDLSEIRQCGRVCCRWESIVRGTLAVPVLLCIQSYPEGDKLAEYTSLITEPEAAYLDHTRQPRMPYNIVSVEISVNYPINSLISHRGWLFLSYHAGSFPPKLLLYCPISKATVQLPSAPYIEAIKYATSSASPNILGGHDRPDDCIVLACFTTSIRSFMYCKPPDKTWKPIYARPEQTMVDDMIFYNGDFYAIDTRGMLQQFKLRLKAPRVDELPTRTMEEEVSSGSSSSSSSSNSRISRYLVQSSLGELLMLSRQSNYIDDRASWRTCSIRVFKMNWETLYWETLRRFEDAGERLFLAHFDSMFVSSSNDYRSNCVYFFDDQSVEHSFFNSFGCDFGVYNMEDQTFEYVLPSEQMRRASYFRWFNPC